MCRINGGRECGGGRLGSRTKADGGSGDVDLASWWAGRRSFESRGPTEAPGLRRGSGPSLGKLWALLSWSPLLLA